MSEEYYDDDELADFVVSEDENQNQNQNPPSPDPEPPHPDRLDSLAPNAPRSSQTSTLLQAHISVLVSALGGPDHSLPASPYKLGHDALACLKDIKRWIRAVDEKNSSLEVALACAECGLIQNDLTVILCQYDNQTAKSARSTEKILLSCLELLVLLTWPTEINKDTNLKDFTEKSNHRRAQLLAKHHILSYKGGKTLKAVIRLGLASLKTPRLERDERDISILRLILFFIRNLLYIEPIPAAKTPKSITNFSSFPHGIDPEDLAIPAVLQAFERNNVLLFLTSIAHSVLVELREESFGLLVVESLSLLTRDVQPSQLFLAPSDILTESSKNVPPASSATGMGLLDLLAEEDKRKKLQNNTVSTRHGRFGTLLSIQNSNNASYFAVLGQKALSSTHNTLEKLDKSKLWHKSSTFKLDSNKFVRRPNVVLGAKAAEILARFLNRLLVTGSFNNLLVFVGKHLTDLANDQDLAKMGILNVIDSHELASYFLTISWFFRYKRERNIFYGNVRQKPPANEDTLTYGSVGAALGEVNFILLVSYFRSSFESKDWNSLHVAMVCLREMLLISNLIFSRERTAKEIELVSEEDINEDRELAEGIIRKLFSQKHFVDMCVNIPKTASKHSPEYLNVVVSIVHILLKSFETLANEDVHLFIKTRRRMKKLNTKEGLNDQMDRNHWNLIDKDSDDEADEDEYRFITQERKLDYENMQLRFFHPDTISTHIEYLSRFEDLSHEEIKRGISFFHRLFVVRKDYSSLFRLDFIVLLQNLHAFLPRSSSVRKHVDEFIVYFMKKFKVALDRFPTALEVLFPRFENSEFRGFIGNGDVEISSIKKSKALTKNSYFDPDAVQPRAALVLRFVSDEKTLDEKIGCLVYYLMKKKSTSKVLTALVVELRRISAVVSEKTESKPSLRLNLANRRLIISDPHLRLLIDVVGFNLPFLQNDETAVRSSMTSEMLSEAAQLLEKWIQLHTQGVGDIEPFLDQFQNVFFSFEAIQFGVESLQVIRNGGEIDSTRAKELELSEGEIQQVIGLARRKEYDEHFASNYFSNLENNLEDDVSSDENGDFEPKSTTSRSRRRKGVALEQLEFSDGEESISAKPQRRLTKAAIVEVPAKSTEMVHDSDDDSDSEEAIAFFQREEKLRRLIEKTGGISNKEHLAMFQQSWKEIVQANNNSHLTDAVTRASGLFVAELDDEDLSNNNSQGSFEDMNHGSAEVSTKRAGDDSRDELGPRKRRMIIDDDE